MIIFPEFKKVTCTQPAPSINKQLSIADSMQDIYNPELHTHETETSSPCILRKKNFHTTVGEVVTFTSVLTIQTFLSCILA
jgi:hypothetical protein